MEENSEDLGADGNIHIRIFFFLEVGWEDVDWMQLA